MRSRQWKYLCIDDERGDRLEAILDRLRRDGLSVELYAPAPFDDEVTLIAESDADGLLLDLRLDDVPRSDGTRVKYRAVALAQELRTRMTEGDIRPLPIVLWSVERKFRRSFSSDRTAHDLFDAVISKTDVSQDPAPVVGRLVALADDYPLIRELLKKRATFWQRSLGLASSQQGLLDPRVGMEILEGAPTHDFARYILRELLESAGPLVDEQLLAARLGVSVASPGWVAVRSWIEPATYRGVFASGWVRWWWPEIEAMLRDLCPSAPFRTLTAEERVGVIKKTLKIRKLEPPVIPVGSTGTRYWYVCAATQVPVDPVDAVLVESGDRRPWQDRVYVSMHAALNRRASAKGLRIHPLEQSRIDELTRD